MHEHRFISPEYFGLPNDRRSQDLCRVLLNKTPAYVHHDSSDVSRVLRRLQEEQMDICEVDMRTVTDPIPLLQNTGITKVYNSYRVHEWQDRRAYLVLRHLDIMVRGNEERWTPALEDAMHVMSIAEKYSGGTLVTFDHSSYAEVTSAAEQSYWLREFFLDFGALVHIA